MNDQDVCGQAAMANTARQLRDNDDYDDDDYEGSFPSVKIEREEAPDRSHWGVYRDEPEKPRPKPTMADCFYGDWDWARKIARQNRIRLGIT